MPTCSQAKIISNLEFDINKRIFNLIHQDQELTNINRSNNNTNTNQNIQTNHNYAVSNNHAGFNMQHTVPMRINDDSRLFKHRSTIYETTTLLQKQQTNLSLSRRLMSKQVHQTSQEDLPVVHYNLHVNHRLPAINNYGRKDSVPINFLFNSPYRHKSGSMQNIQPITRSPTKFTLKTPAPNTNEIEHVFENVCENENDNEDAFEENEHAISDANSSSSWASSGGDNYNMRNSIDEIQREFTAPLQKTSIDEIQREFTAPLQKTNIDDQNDLNKKNNLSSNQTAVNPANLFSSLPKLALEIEQIDDAKSDSTNDEEAQKSAKKRFSITGAKRLLALASIRPSKTFHKEITQEEAEILKKYYDIIKPKLTTNQLQSQNEALNKETNKADVVPILYDTGKINYDTFTSLEMFLSEHKADILNGKLHIEYNIPGYNGFVLRNVESEQIIKFPSHVHDTFVAVAISVNAKGNPNLDENHILKSINWNDTRHILAPKTKVGKRSKSHDTHKTSVPTVSLDSIRELSRLVNTISEPKFLKRVAEGGVDLSSLPGGINFEMPPCSADEYITSHMPNSNKDENYQENGCKLKNTVYKKLKDKVASSKVMWFSAPPTRKQLSVVFEYAGFDLTHETILEEANKSLQSVGQIVEVEFVPRSVHFGSVYVQNLWILTLNDKDAKYYTISHGIEISGQKVVPKSYDEYIYTEYEKYIRTEKYKQMIKSHEKAVHSKNKK